jgi:hypothetical protein
MLVLIIFFADIDSSADDDEEKSPEVEEEEGPTEEDLFSSLRAKLEQKFRELTSSEVVDESAESPPAGEKPITAEEKRRLRRGQEIFFDCIQLRVDSW